MKFKIRYKPGLSRDGIIVGECKIVSVPTSRGPKNKLKMERFPVADGSLPHIPDDLIRKHVRRIFKEEHDKNNTNRGKFQFHHDTETGIEVEITDR